MTARRVRPAPSLHLVPTGEPTRDLVSSSLCWCRPEQAYRDLATMAVAVLGRNEILPSWARADRQTCSMRCHVAAWRARGRANGSRLVHRTTPAVADASTASAAVISASEPRAA